MKITRKYYWITIILIAISVLLALANTSQPLIIEYLINNLGVSSGKVFFWGSIYLGSIIAIILIELCRKLLESKFVSGLKDYLRTQITHGLLSRNPRSFSEQTPQEYISILNNDVSVVVEEYYVKLIDFIFQTLSILFSCTVLTQIYFPLAIVAVGTSVMIAVVPFFFKTKLQSSKKEDLDSLGKFNMKFSDVVFAHSEIRIQQIKGAIHKIVELASQDSEDKEYKCARTQAWSEITIGFFSFMGTFLIVVLGGYQVHLGKLDVGGLFAAIQLSDQLVMPILGISNSLNSIIATNKIKEKLADFIGKDERSTELEYEIEEGIQEIYIDNLTLEFSERCVFNGFSQKFEKNKKYLIVGQNGSGKSSLVHLIMNDFVAQEATVRGTIYINGKEQNEIPEKVLFDEVTVVSQVPYIFSGTVKDNLTLFQSIDMQKLEDLEELLDEHMLELIRDKRIVSNDNSHLSNGEREKIALLRALMKGVKWIILDEATAALDKESKERFENYLLKREDLTIIHISHNYGEHVKNKYDEIITISQ